MKSVSAAFKTIWARKYGMKECVRVLYLRAYWNGSAYAYESPSTVSGWNELEQDAVPPLRSMTWKLDTPALNEFKASTVVLSVNDLDRRWLPADASPSLFAPNVSEQPCLWSLTKFRIQFGYILDDGTKEWCSLFTGLLDDYRMDGESPLTELTIVDFGRKLKAGDAQNVSTAFTLENCVPATGDGSRTDFTTTSTGVGRLDVVQVNGVTMTQGTDYNIARLNSDLTATISFVVAPGNTFTVKCTGIKWKADQSIETLIGLLCDEAGITDRTINAVVFPGGVSSSKTIDSQANWEAGTALLNQYDAASVAGDLSARFFDRFADGLYTGRTAAYAPTWTIQSGPSGLGSISASTAGLLVAAQAVFGFGSKSYIGAPLAKSTGSWRFKAKLSNESADASATVGSAVVPYSLAATAGKLKGYGLRWKRIATTIPNNLDLVRWDDEDVTDGTVLASIETAYVVGENHVWTLTVNGSGDINLYRNSDATAVATVNDTTYTSATLFTSAAQVDESFGGAPSSSVLVTDIFYSSATDATFVVQWESAAQDLLAAPTAFGVLNRTETLNSGTIAYATATSTDGVSWDAYVAIAGDGAIQSALKRYLKIRVTMTMPLGDYNSPVCSKLVAYYATSSVFLAVANFTSKTCYAAIQRLAQLADYEWGFTGTGSFFFRSKTVSGDAVIELNQENAIAGLSNYRPGTDGVFTKGRVRYGPGDEYEASYSCANAGESSPTPIQKYGERIRDESITDLLLANDAQIADARAQSIHDNNHLPKKTFRLDCRMIPHLDLADIASVSYYNRPRDADPMLGDPLQTWDDSGFGPPLNVLARDMRVKVLGVTHNFPRGRQDGFKTGVDCQEILS